MTLLHADDRAYLTVQHSGRIALGNPTAPLLTLNTADEYGCMWLVDEPEGWDAPDVVTPVDRRQSGHGGYAGEPTYDPRTLTLTGSVAAPTAGELVRAYRRLLTAVLGSSPAFVRYTHLDADPAPMGLWVLPASGKPKWTARDDRYAEFSFLLVAEDPIKTGAAITAGPIRLRLPGSGATYPTGPAALPWTASGGTPASASTVELVPNAGDEDAHAVYTVRGPVPRPRIAVGDTQQVTLNDDLGPYDTWVVDTAAGAFTVNGANRYDAWGAGSTFPLIPGNRVNPDGTVRPGGAQVRLQSAGGGTDQAAGLTVLTASSWR